MVTKTTNSLPFGELKPDRFEMLVMDMIYRMRRWEKIEHFGVSGSDDAIDINAVEILENGKKVIHHFQCKNYKEVKASQLRSIVKDYCQKNTDRPDYYYVVCGCSVSKKQAMLFKMNAEKMVSLQPLFGQHHFWNQCFMQNTMICYLFSLESI